MTTFSLRNVRLRTGEQFRSTVTVQLEPLLIGGQEYAPVPADVPAELTITKATSGSVYQAVYFFSVPLHFDRAFTRGVIDTRPLVLYGSMTLFCLFLTVRSLERRRWA